MIGGCKRVYLQRGGAIERGGDLTCGYLVLDIEIKVGVVGELSATRALLFLLSLWEKVARSTG